MRFASIVPLLIGTPVTWPLAGADVPEVVQVWPGAPPDETGAIGPERTRMSPELDRTQVEVTESTRMVTDVTRPTLTVYPAPKAESPGTAVLIFPGGGYWNLYWQLEGEEVAAWLNSIGVTGILLKYRVPRRPDEPQGEPARRPLQDAQRAISLVRKRASGWGLDPEKIGVVGFSAGGHLAIAPPTSFEKRTYQPIDDVDRVSCRPDFAILVYPGYLKAADERVFALPLESPDGAQSAEGRLLEDILDLERRAQLGTEPGRHRPLQAVPEEAQETLERLAVSASCASCQLSCFFQHENDHLSFESGRGASILRKNWRSFRRRAGLLRDVSPSLCQPQLVFLARAIAG